MLLSAVISVALAFATSGILATSTIRRTPQITCKNVETYAPYMFLGNFLPGFNASYRLSDALAAVRSTSSAGENPEVLQNSGPFSGDNFKL